MSKMKWVRKGATGLLTVMLVTGGTFPSIASANGSVDFKNEEKLSTIELVNPELSSEEIASMVKEYANSEGLTEAESLDLFYEEALTQKIELESNKNTIQNNSSPNQAPGKAKYKGDVMYSKAWTGINHGHSAIYYTTTTVVHAPGPGKKSKAESAYNKIGLKNGIKMQYVKTTQTNRNKAANYAYNNLRNKPYDLNFAANKLTTSRLNCSGLVWFAYEKSVGINLDGNGGPGVYPSNIRDSSKTVTYASK
ncbi:YiiX/YebB-like N1pC/P60 family cysteine hydrolase [Ornithinibacillus scapharcae]|uniref:YiiX/YebB-like N1pC/P60 family cysteine hydrolase n=1 Tax=Ornithinibacillus scapharcae TaxID=1147159 RepID=UPI000225B0B4|nr:YiiX/YebB-like N1pC/P60 family cysteine hydrolase [Ornithinibacillus scapharcae]